MKKYLVIMLTALAVTCFEVHLYLQHKATKEIVETVTNLQMEIDTTSSLRNYEVLVDSLNNTIKKWHHESGR